MIKSMTAFARTQSDEHFGSLVCELRSVNHRFLELYMRLPDELRAQETQYRDIISKKIKRGKLECNVRLKLHAAASDEIHIDQKQASAVIDACHMINDLLHQPSEVNPMEILNWPGVVQETGQDMKPVYSAMQKLLAQALDELIANREREGKRLAELLLQRCDRIQAKLDELQTQVDNDRMEQEILHFIQKMDVEEELDRLDCHLMEMKEILARDEAIGRRLDFLMQELNREANTLGSKSADITSTQASVELKVLIEQMREQIQNIE